VIVNAHIRLIFSVFLLLLLLLKRKPSIR
jgi:hypothetical protein